MAAEPDSQAEHVPRDGAEIAAELRPRTVAFAAYAKKPEDGSTAISVGSAAPVQIAGRYFLLTAGHCVADLVSAPWVTLIIKRDHHTFSPNFARRRAVTFYDGARDFGYVEVGALDAGTISSAEKIFTGPKRIAVLRAGELERSKVRVVIAGFPRATAVESNLQYAARFIHIDAPVATPTLKPQSPLPAAAPIEAIDVWMSRADAVDSLDAEEGPAVVPQLAGVSGGGCWFPGQPLEAGVPWAAGEMKLVGLHVGSASADIIHDGEAHLFTRTILIGHHLKLIADDFPDLREEMLRMWPGLDEFTND